MGSNRQAQQQQARLTAAGAAGGDAPNTSGLGSGTAAGMTASPAANATTTAAGVTAVVGASHERQHQELPASQAGSTSSLVDAGRTGAPAPAAASAAAAAATINAGQTGPEATAGAPATASAAACFTSLPPAASVAFPAVPLVQQLTQEVPDDYGDDEIDNEDFDDI